MLASISPFGERARGQRWPVTVTAYTVGSAAGGAAVGGTLGLAGAAADHAVDLSTATAHAVLACLALGGLALDARRRGRHAPGPQRQVDETWLSTYRGWVYGAGFGLQLGAAFTTIVSSSITYVAFACALLGGSVAGGALIGLVFGVTRALPLLLTVRVHDPASLRGFVQRLDAALPRARVAVAVTLVLAAVAAAAGATHVVGGA